MSEWRLFDDDVAHVSTLAFHKDRARARHLEDPKHRERLLKAAEYVRVAARAIGEQDVTVSDLGCGDGGLLYLINDLHSWGYDFCPANIAGWDERGVSGQFLDVFGVDGDRVRFGDVTVVTEVLEHLTDPHGAVKWIRANSRFIVASSPWDEAAWVHDPCHAWAFDFIGYRNLINGGGFRILRHERVGRFQVVLGEAL